MNPAVIMAITRVLYKHECAVIPGFGAFILRKNYGMANPFSGQLKPSVHTLFFNSNIHEDDGFVANELKEICGLQFRQSSTLLGTEFNTLHANCTNTQAISMGDLGKFHRNAVGDLFFLANPNLNLSKETFGLPIIDWSWKDVPNYRPESNSALVVEKNNESNRIELSTTPIELVEKTVSVETVSESNDKPSESIVINSAAEIELLEDSHHSEFTESKRKTPLIWRMAASFAVISIGAGVLLSIAQIWSVSTGNDMASLIPQDSQRIHPSAAVKSNQDSFVVVDENQHSTESTNSVIVHKLKYASGVHGIEAFKHANKELKGKYVIVGGAYLTPSLGESECLLWQRLGIDACLVKGKKSSLYKVVLGRFETDQMASDYAETIKILPTGTLSVSDIALDWNN